MEDPRGNGERGIIDYNMWSEESMGGAEKGWRRNGRGRLEWVGWEMQRGMAEGRGGWPAGQSAHQDHHHRRRYRHYCHHHHYHHQ